MKKRYLLSLLSVSITCALQAQAASYPEPIGPSQSDFGGVGLMQVPTARMAKEGEFSLNYRYNDQYRFYSTSIALMPWLEATVRYTDVRTRRYSVIDSFSGNQTYKDKAFDLKLRLWEEGFWLPEVAVGTRDLGGTGLFDSEYLVATKAWGPFDSATVTAATALQVQSASVTPSMDRPPCSAASNTRRRGSRCA